MVVNILWGLLGVLALAGIFFTLYGLVHFGLCLRKGRGDIDESNVWNRLMGVTYVAMHPEVFGGIDFWHNDLCENIKLVKQAVESIESCGSSKTHVEIDVRKISKSDIDKLLGESQLDKGIIKPYRKR